MHFIKTCSVSFSYYYENRTTLPSAIETNEWETNLASVIISKGPKRMNKRRIKKIWNWFFFSLLSLYDFIWMCVCACVSMCARKFKHERESLFFYRKKLSCASVIFCCCELSLFSLLTLKRTRVLTRLLPYVSGIDRFFILCATRLFRLPLNHQELSVYSVSSTNIKRAWTFVHIIQIYME